MTRAKPKLITYVYMGMVERGCGKDKPNYTWHEGYCEKSICDRGADAQPWLTKLEAQRDARSCGGMAIFERQMSPHASLRGFSDNIPYDPYVAAHLDLFQNSPFTVLSRTETPCEFIESTPVEIPNTFLDLWEEATKKKDAE